MTNDLTNFDDNEREIDIFTPVTVFDVERFDQVDRVAKVMSRASLIPETLKGADINATYSNCFIVANLAANWGLDPFSVAQAVSLVFGKLVIEGKLIRAVIRKYLKFDLSYRYFGELGEMERRVYVSDRPLVKDVDGVSVPFTEDEITALMENQSFRISKGTLQKWHTKSKSGAINDNWQKDENKMFRERGAREWCREYAPGLMLGVYTPDEFDEVEITSRSNKARDVTPSNPLLEDNRSDGASMDRIDRETGEVLEQKSGTQNGSTGKTTSRRSASTSNSSSTSSSSQGDDEQSGGSTTSSSQRAPAGTFHEFSMALLRFGGTGNGRDADMQKISSASDAFWPGNGGKPDHRADVALSKAIMSSHLKRMAGEIQADAMKVEVTKVIDSSFNGL